jgi:taurine dioxygenase
MITIDPLTPSIGASLSGLDFTQSLSDSDCDEIYQALLKHLVIFIRGVDIGPKEHLEFAKSFGELDAPHLLYPYVEGFENIVLLENDAERPPDTNSWHTDLTYKTVQPFASVLIARDVPKTGGDTMWSSSYSAYDRLSPGMKRDLEGLEAIHDLGDFRNSYVTEKDGQSRIDRLTESVTQFGHNIRPLVGVHPVSGVKFLNFNEAFVTHIVGFTPNESSSLMTFLANHMNLPEDQVRWRWSNGDLAMWDNRVTMHYAVADYSPQYRCMNRVTIVRDRRDNTQATTF